MSATLDDEPDLTNQIIGLAIKIHRRLGPGLLEFVYHRCLCWELHNAGIPFKTQVPLPVIYEGVQISSAHFADIVVDEAVLLELKAVEHVLPVHRAQTRTYLRLSNCRVALLMNFNSALLKDDLHRFTLQAATSLPPRRSATPAAADAAS